MVNLTPKYLRDKNGKLMRAEDFLKREAKGWGNAFGKVFVDFVGTGKQAIKETAQLAENTISGTTKKGRR